MWLDNNGWYHIITHAYVPVDLIAPYRYADVTAAHGMHGRIYASRVVMCAFLQKRHDVLCSETT
eukprot:COSAG05_NODE_1208_length_5523_cov_14.095686_6_plen_64_part_00